jgi:hypothetical protein
MGILPRPLRMRGYIGWREKSTDGIAPEWAAWCRRWRETSVPRPKIREPKNWTISTCASFIAALGRLNVDELSLASSTHQHVSSRSGQPMMSHSRASFLYALRRFFIDYELWGWGRLQFSPYRHLATPNTRHSVAASIPG